MISRPIVSGFIRIVRKHWETSSLRKAVANHSLNVSEEMLLGLGGTASITFWYARDDVFPFAPEGTEKLLSSTRQALILGTLDSTC